MKVPIRLNRRSWPDLVTKLLPSAEDPRVLLDGRVGAEEFSKAVSVFKFGNTFKSTRAFRYPKTIDFLEGLEFPSPPVILDVGASDGITSTHTIRTLSFRKYYVTDLNIETLVDDSGPVTYFHDQQANVVLAVTDRFVVYADCESSLFPFNWIAPRFFRRAPAERPEKRVLLINPSLQPPPEGVEVCCYNIFDPWQGEKPDLVIAANILNPIYFEDEEIRVALRNMRNALNPNGWLAVIDNRDREQSSVFQLRQGRFEKVHSVASGTDVEDLVLSLED